MKKLNKKLYLTLSLGIIFSSCSHSPSVLEQPRTNRVIQSVGESEAPYCEYFKDRFAENLFDVDCEAKFHHYQGVLGPQTISTQSNFRIGSFNAFHFGDKMGEMKDLDSLVIMMARWDLVGFVEIMPFTKERQKVFEELSQSKMKMNVFNLPDYQQLLLKLREKDPSWSLLISPQATGDGSNELAGFYYRSKKLSPIENDYCKALGCIPTFEKNPELLSREPFMASFKSGKFDFTAMLTHTRFRVPADKDLALKVNNFYNSFSNVKIGAEEAARFVEIKVVADWIGNYLQNSKEKDFVWMGDYNLVYDDEKEKQIWPQAIKSFKGAQVFVSEKTSLSAKNGTASNYDHFIANPQETAECSFSKARPLYFFDAKSVALPVNDEKFWTSYKTQLRKNFEDELSKKWIVAKGESKARPMNKAEIEDRLAFYDENVVNDPKESYQRFIQLLSDHLPIEIECRTN